MPFDAARAFNRRCPPGTLVEVTLRSGETRTGRTRGPAIVWAGYALVEVEGWPGYWTVQAVRPKHAVAVAAPRPCDPAGSRPPATRSAGPAPRACAE
jgi:hypothetical protein